MSLINGYKYYNSTKLGLGVIVMVTNSLMTILQWFSNWILQHTGVPWSSEHFFHK